MIYTLLIKDCNSCTVCPFNVSTAVPSVPMFHFDSLFPQFQDVGGVFCSQSNTLLSYNWLINACIGCPVCPFDSRPVCIGCPVMFYPDPHLACGRSKWNNYNRIIDCNFTSNQTLLQSHSARHLKLRQSTKLIWHAPHTPIITHSKEHSFLQEVRYFNM